VGQDDAHRRARKSWKLSSGTLEQENIALRSQSPRADASLETSWPAYRPRANAGSRADCPRQFSGTQRRDEARRPRRQCRISMSVHVGPKESHADDGLDILTPAPRCAPQTATSQGDNHVEIFGGGSSGGAQLLETRAAGARRLASKGWGCCSRTTIEEHGAN